MSWGNKIALVTGAYSGIGQEICAQLAEQGFDLVLVGRNQAALGALAAGLGARFPQRHVRSFSADLCDHEALRYLAADLHTTLPGLDLLIHNAAAALDGLQASPQGRDVHYEVNTAAPYLLTHLLDGLLHRGSQIVLVSSSAMRMARTLDTGELIHPRQFARFRPYVLSKLAGAAAMVSLARAYAERGVMVRIVDPGPAKTAMSKSAAIPGWFRLFRFLFKSPAAAATRIVDVATAPQHANTTAAYFERGKAVPLFAPLSDVDLQDRLAKEIGTLQTRQLVAE